MPRGFLVLSCLLALLAAGCNGLVEREDFSFDGKGWGGPNLKYSTVSSENLIRIEQGMLVNADFRWAENELSFEFLDSRDLVWGIMCMDSVFQEGRRDELSKRTMSKVGDGVYVPGRKLPPDQLWKYDVALDAMFIRDQEGRGYRVLNIISYEQFIDQGRQAVRVVTTQNVGIRPNAWNTFSARFRAGKLTYSINGEPGGGAQVDQRANGYLGILVRAGTGPFLIRNLKLGRTGGVDEP